MAFIILFVIFIYFLILNNIIQYFCYNRIINDYIYNDYVRLTYIIVYRRHSKHK